MKLIISEYAMTLPDIQIVHTLCRTIKLFENPVVTRKRALIFFYLSKTLTHQHFQHLNTLAL